jgi:hypothetical protein
MVVSGGSLGGDILVSFSDVHSAYVVLYDFQTYVKRIPSISGVSYHLSGSLEMAALQRHQQLQQMVWRGAMYLCCCFFVALAGQAAGAFGISSAPPPASRTIESRIRLSKSTRSINRTDSHRMKERNVSFP